MKKLITMIGLILLLSSCGMYIGEEKSENFQFLSNQYDAYIDHDISEEEQFYQLINDAMIGVMPSIVKIEVSIFSNLNILVETRISSGVIFDHIEDEYYIFIDQNQTNILVGQKVIIRAIDYMNNIYLATQIYDDHIEPITIVSITSKYHRYDVIDMATYIPKIGEPVLLLGNHYKIQNATSMGLITNYRFDLNRMYTSIPSDELSHGGAIINNQLQLIGLQTELFEDTSVFITLDAIINTITNYYQLERK